MTCWAQLAATRADAASLRERLATAEAALEDERRSLTWERDEAAAKLATAEANGEARRRAEAEAARLRADMEEMVAAIGRDAELDAKLASLAGRLTDNFRAIDAAIVSRAERAEAEVAELRGLVEEIARPNGVLCRTCGDTILSCFAYSNPGDECPSKLARAWLRANPATAAIPEGTP